MHTHHADQSSNEAGRDNPPAVTGTRGGLRRFWALITRTRPPVLVLAIALVTSIGATVVGLAVPLFMKGIVDGFSLAHLDGGHIAMIAAAFAAQAVCSGLSLYLLTFAGQKIVAGLRDLVWTKQLALKVPYFDRKESGDLVSRMNNDTAVVKTLIAENVAGFVTGVISIIGAVCLMLALDWRMTLVMLAALPIAAAVMVPLGRTMRRISKGTMDENAKFTSVLSRALSEIRLVKASNAEPREYQRGKGAIQGLFRFGLKEGRINAMIMPLMSFVMMALLVVIIGYGGVRISSGAMSAGGLVAFILYLIQVISPIGQITGFFTQMQKARGATESIVAILDEPEEKADEGLPVPETALPIVVRDLGFAYRDGHPVLQGVSFTLQPGTVTALVGPSGGGKTTVFSILERFYEPQSGTVTLGDTPIASFALAQWRRRIGYVSQDSPLLAGTIR
jgi:ATP-binding cassette subfamily B protein AbcA/BmrA